MIGLRTGLKTGIRSGVAVGIGADAISSGAAVGALPAFGAAGSAVSGTGALSPAWPTHAANDIALMIVATVQATVDPGDPTLSVAAGFTLLASALSVFGGGAQNARCSVFIARATSSGMTAPTIADGYDIGLARILTFTGCSSSGVASDCVDVLGPDWGNDAYDVAVAVTGPVAPTSDVRRLAVIAIGGYAVGATTASGWANSDLSSVTEIADSFGDGMNLAAATGAKLTAGTFGTTTATLTGNSVLAGVALALKP